VGKADKEHRIVADIGISGSSRCMGFGKYVGWAYKNKKREDKRNGVQVNFPLKRGIQRKGKRRGIVWWRAEKTQWGEYGRN
jgi:hypothetical protein